MKRFILFSVLLLSALPLRATATRVQSIHNYSATSATLNGTVAGNTLVFSCSWNDDTSSPTVSGGSLSWTTNISADTAAQTSILISVASNISGGNVTASLSTSPADSGCNMVEYNVGGASGGAIDKTCAYNSGGASAHTQILASCAATTATDLFYMHYANESNNLTGVPCTNTTSPACTGIFSSVIQYDGTHVDGNADWLSSAATCTSACAGVSAGTYTVGYNQSSGTLSSLFVVAIKLASAGGTTRKRAIVIQR